MPFTIKQLAELIFKQGVPGIRFESPQGSKPNKILALCLFLIVGLPTAICSLFPFAPITFFQIINAIYQPSVGQYIGIVVAMLSDWCLMSAANYDFSRSQMSQCIKYLYDILRDGNHITPRTKEADPILNDLNHEKPYALLGKEPICNVFKLVKTKKGNSFGQYKSFTFNLFAIKGITMAAAPPIFIHSEIEDLTTAQQFLLYHEIGHSSKHSWRAKRNSPLWLFLKMLPLFLFAFYYNQDNEQLLLWLVPAFVWQLLVTNNAFLNEFFDEIEADRFAVRNLPSSTNFEMLSASIQRLFKNKLRLRIVQRFVNARIELNQLMETGNPSKANKKREIKLYRMLLSGKHLFYFSWVTCIVTLLPFAIYSGDRSIAPKMLILYFLTTGIVNSYTLSLLNDSTKRFAGIILTAAKKQIPDNNSIQPNNEPRSIFTNMLYQMVLFPANIVGFVARYGWLELLGAGVILGVIAFLLYKVFIYL